TLSPQRAAEEAYLDRLWLKHKIWLETYTPMAGVARLQVANKAVKRRVDAEIPPEFKPFRQKIQETFRPERPTREQPFEDIVEAVAEARQLVILGEPGAGKTTTLWKLAADYADQARSD